MAETSNFKLIYSEEVYRISDAPVVVLPCPWSEVGDEYRLPLSKILQALTFSLDAIRIIHQVPLDLSTFTEKPKRIIAFVDPPKGLGFYDLYVTEETSIVFADGLKVLNADEATKRKFWTALKALFPS